MGRQVYRTDLSDAEWAILESWIAAPLPGGRPAKWSRREIVNGQLDVLRNGCQWDVLPHDFPPYKTVYDYYRQWRRSGLWERINTTWRERLRIELGRDPQPGAAIIDSQSVKTSEKGAARFRRRQENQRVQAARLSGHPRLPAQSESASSRYRRSRRGRLAVSGYPDTIPPDQAFMGRCGLSRPICPLGY
jgi:transposase